MLPLLVLLTGAAAASTSLASGDGCRVGCPLALAAYYFSAESNLTFIASLFGIADTTKLLLPYNPVIANPDYIVVGYRVIVPFPCSCLGLPADPASTFLAGSLSYTLSAGDTYGSVASEFANLTTASWLAATNDVGGNNLEVDGKINVAVNCSCGDRRVSPRYGQFLTYPLWEGETFSSVAEHFGLSSPAQLELLRRYNPGMDSASGKGIMFIPVKDPDGSYHPLKSGAGTLLYFCEISYQTSTSNVGWFVQLTETKAINSCSTTWTGSGLSGGAVAGIVVTCIVILIVGIWLFTMYYRQQKMRKAISLSSPVDSVQLRKASQAAGMKADRCIKFSYEELSDATNNFSMEHKIGQGGFGSVYYAELRGEKAAIKKMDKKASQEFLAELKVLTSVHHSNLVRLIGYCVESCLFLVYEFIENGNLSQHLHGTGYEPLPWTSRVQIALDSARGLEYIHEHAVPEYVHRDIKSANILIDKDFRAKIADFGLTKLSEIGTTDRVVGTFGYMPPEYVRYGEVSPKVDVYAFGIVLYELLSAKEAIVKSTEYAKGLFYMFEKTRDMPNPKEALQELIDPRLGDYPIDSVVKVANLAKSCTHQDPKMRPTMRSVVVALMTLSSKDQDQDQNHKLTRGQD